MKKQLDTAEINNKILSPIIFIALVGTICYFNALFNGFVWDDKFLVLDNACIRDFKHIAEIFTTNVYSGTPGEQSNFYRPLQNILLLVIYQFWSTNSLIYHLANVILHIGCAILLYLLILVLLKNKTAALMASLLWVCHPVHTQAVAYISGVADPMCAVFIMLSFIFFNKFIDDNKVSKYIVSIIFFVLALLSKEIAIIYPLILLCYIYSFKKGRGALRKSLVFLVVFGFYLVLRYYLGLDKVTIYAQGIDFYSRALTFFYVFCNYIKLLIVPFPLHPDHVLSYITSIKDFRAIASIAFFALFLALSLAMHRKSKEIFFGLAFFLIYIIATSNIFVRINAQMAEHWLYFPSMGLFMAISLVAANFIDIFGRAAKYAVWSIVIFFMAAYSFLTIRQNVFWKDEKTLYTYTLRYSPNSARVHYNLAGLFRENGDIDSAISEYNAAIAIKDDYVEAYNNLGNIYDAIGKSEEAVKEFKKSLHIKPNYVTYNSLGLVYYSKGQWDAAIDMYMRAKSISPSSVAVYINLGNAYYQKGDMGNAGKNWKTALDLDPSNNIISTNLKLIGRNKL